MKTSKGSAHGLLEMPCLGRPFQLGTLYDCRNDSLIPGVTLWGPDTLGTAKETMMETSDFEVITEDSLNAKTLHLDVSAGLKLSILSGLVKASGSGKFLYDRTTSKNQVRVSLRYKATSKFEQLNMRQLGHGKVEYPQVFEDDIVTHVVTGVQYGADAFFVFDRQVDSQQDFQQVHDSMEAMIKVLPVIGVGAGLDIQNKGKERMEKIQCKFYGDFILPKNPTTYQDAVRVYQELPKLLGGAGYPNSVPKKVWLCPLSKLDSRVQRTVRGISSYLIHDLQEVMESLHELEVRINDLLRNEVCACFVGIGGDLEKSKRLIGSYKVKIMKNLSTLLPKVRGGGEEEGKLAELLEMNRILPFSYEQVSSWIEEKEMEVSILAVYLKELKKHEIVFVFQSDQMVTLTSDFEVDSVLCFDFNISAGKDAFSERMEAYMHGSENVAQIEVKLQTPWYKSQELRQQLQRFVDFVIRNSKDSTCKYAVTNGYYSKSSKVGAMVVFIDAYPTEFEPPDQPGVPHASNKTHNSLQLSWSKPKYGSDSVQSYTVSYHSVDDPPDQWSTQTSSEECAVLTNLTPGSLYHFKVTAESVIGSSLESEVGEERLPPDQPGKPWAVAITPYSIQLQWNKPKHGAETVKSYIVKYCCYQFDQWTSQTITDIEESALLYNLIPKRSYQVKVQAVSSVGVSPESEISDLIETPLPPPGKPHASRITSSGLHLIWDKPEEGVGFVQSYSVLYRIVHNSKWNVTTTVSPKAFIVLGDLIPDMFYYFKVRAETATGPSAESTVSDLVQYKLASLEEPHISNVTHNSLRLNWKKPKHGAEYVQNYTVLYCSGNDEWITKTTTTAVEFLTVTNLCPGKSYYFKVRAETATGSIGESNTSTVTLPPGQPGKLRATNVTHNSIQLQWDKPKHGAKIVLCYTVLYRSAHSDKWKIQSTNVAQQSIELTGLIPKHSYYFKIQAVNNIGKSPESKIIGPIETLLPPPGKPHKLSTTDTTVELKWDHSFSELSDPIETLLPPPGKPYATNITHNSIQLSWEKPVHGGESVQFYRVIYRSVEGSPDQWNTQTSSEECLVLTKLTPGSLYHFKVTAQSAVGFCPESEVGHVRLPPDQPGKPWVVTITPYSIQLQWDKPKHGAKIVESYIVNYRCYQFDPWSSYSTTDAQESVMLTNLIPKRSYCVNVQAVSTVGASPFSEIIGPIETPLPIDQPGKPWATIRTSSSIQVQWAKPKEGAETIQFYTVLYRSDQYDQWSVLSTTDAREYALLPNLESKTIYYVKVQAMNNGGKGSESELSDPIETLLPPPGKPYTSKKTHNSIQLSWEKPERGAESVVAYTVFSRYEHDPPEKWNFQTSKSITESVDFTNFRSGSVYYFKVRAVTATGPSPESDICKVIMPPGQPGTPQVAGKTLDSIYLAWAKPVHGDTSVQSYTVLYCSMADPSRKWYSQSTKRAEEFMNVSNLLPGAVYNFKIRAENAGGSSLDSDSVKAVLPPDQPGKPHAFAVYHYKIVLRWNPPKHGPQIVSSYLISYRSVSSKKWQPHTSQCSDSATIVGLTPKTAYVFKVRAETADAGSSSYSELSDPIETLMSPPGKPHATDISYESFKIKWKKPECKGLQCYKVVYHLVEDPIDKWFIYHTHDSKNSHTFNATPGKLYVFKVSAVTSEGPTAESEISDPIQTKIKPWGVTLLSSCKKIASTKGESPTHLLPLKITMKKKDISKVVVGEISSKRFMSATAVQHKVLMVVGATGAGKSTLINRMANYIMGVDWKDDFRFKLISEETTHDQTKSQTQCITAYTFYKEYCKGSPLPYTLTVIDTPGFGDTGGLERDKEIVAQIKEFFSIRGDEGIDQLHGIGFVTQAPLARLTPTQRYVFDSILSVFGKEVADNIFLMITFADGMRPPVLDAIAVADVPFKSHFKFNNFASNQANDEFDAMFWRMGKKSFEYFFNQLTIAKPTSIQLSREVLQEREQLEVKSQGLRPLIRAGLAKIDELQQERRLLKDNEDDIITHGDFTYQVQVVKCRKIDLPTGRYTTNCLKCTFTCHESCARINDEDKFKCSVMDNSGSQDATCSVCPGRCSWKDHVCNPYKFEIYLLQKTQTSEELQAKYDSVLTDKSQVKEVIMKIESELKEITLAVLQVIKQAYRIMQRLLEIALKPHYFTEVDYIDLLIESEKHEVLHGWSERVAALYEIRKQSARLMRSEHSESELLTVKKADILIRQLPDPDVQGHIMLKLWPNFTDTRLLPDQAGNRTQLDWKKPTYAVTKTRTVSVGVQFNYLVPMSESLRGVKIVGEKLFSINGALPQLLEWEEYGFRVQVPAGATTGPCDIGVKAIISGDFEFPEGCQLVSALYAISASRKLDKPVSIEIEHCVRLENEQDCKYMCFGIAMCNQEVLPYTFEILRGGIFIPRTKFGKICRSSFSIAVVFKMNAPDPEMDSSHSEDENEEQSVVVPTDDSESGVESQGESSSATNSTQTLGDNTPKNQYVALPFLECQAAKRNFLWKLIAVYDLQVLTTWLGNNNIHGEIGDPFKFVFKDSCSFLQLKVPREQEPVNGWLICPSKMPCRIYQSHVDEFLGKSFLTCCLVSVLLKPGEKAENFLRYSVVIENILPETELFIHCSLNQFSTGAADRAVEHRASVDGAGGLSSAHSDTQSLLDKLQREPTIPDLLNKVSFKASDKWELIGLQLNIEGHQLTTISTETKNAILRHERVFRMWQTRGSPPFTWATIVNALRAPIVGEERLANDLEEWVKSLE